MYQGKHPHFPQTMIDDSLIYHNQEWKRLKAALFQLTDEVKDKYDDFEPLIRYFEYEMKKNNQHDARKISDKLDGLRQANLLFKPIF